MCYAIINQTSSRSISWACIFLQPLFLPLRGINSLEVQKLLKLTHLSLAKVSQQRQALTPTVLNQNVKKKYCSGAHLTLGYFVIFVESDFLRWPSCSTITDNY